AGRLEEGDAAVEVTDVAPAALAAHGRAAAAAGVSGGELIGAGEGAVVPVVVVEQVVLLYEERDRGEQDAGRAGLGRVLGVVGSPLQVELGSGEADGNGVVEVAVGLALGRGAGENVIGLREVVEQHGGQEGLASGGEGEVSRVVATAPIEVSRPLVVRAGDG